MKTYFPIALFIISLIMLSVVFRSNIQVEQPSVKKFNEDDDKVKTEIIAVKVPEKIFFADEPVPMEIFDVRERLDRELLVNTYWQSNSLQLFKLANRWFPIIEEILEEECVPDDFKYLALIESGLRNVISSRNAVGIWQFLSGTGKEYGLEVNRVVDERYHVEKSTYAACKYLKKAHREFGSWTLAAASYNMGKYRLKKVLSDQSVESYYNLYLNDETARYVFRILAVKEIFNHPIQYGFYLDKEDLYKPISYKIVEVKRSIDDLPAFAIEHGTNYKTLKLLNPWLRQPYLKNHSRKTYELKLPI